MSCLCQCKPTKAPSGHWLPERGLASAGLEMRKGTWLKSLKRRTMKSGTLKSLKKDSSVHYMFPVLHVWG